MQKSLQSIFDQTYSSWEVILVDDASTDNFEEIMKEFVHDVRIRVFRNSHNLGAATTKALCSEYASGIIAGYLDPDDALDCRALEIMINEHMEHPGASIVHSTNYICDHELEVIKVSDCPKSLPDNIPYLLLGDGSIHHFVAFKLGMYRQSVKLEKSREHDRASDQELYYLLEEQGTVYFVNLPLHYYRIHKGSISNMGNEAKTLNQHYHIIQKACIRRISSLKNADEPFASKWIRIYRARYFKIKTLCSFRERKWFRFIANLFLYTLSGGAGNLKTYFYKLPKEGTALLRRSFTENYDAIK